jgi:hypothetical protein
MRGKLIVLGVVVALVSMMTAADAGVGAGTGTTPVNCRSTTFEKIPVSGVNQFRTLGGLETGISAIYPVTVTVSLVVQGKPAKIKVQDTYVSQRDTASPGVITLRPVHGKATPFTFTFLAIGDSAALRGHTFKVRWKRATHTGISTILEGTMTLSYQTDACTGGFSTP